MNSYRNSRMIIISIELLYLFHFSGIVCVDTEIEKKDEPAEPPKESKFATLPLVLLKGEKNEYSFPHCFRKNSDKKLVDFLATNEKKTPVYFCPKSSEDRLLIPVDGSNYDTCKTQPKPMLRKMESKGRVKGCEGDKKDLYSYGYKYSKPEVKGQTESFSWKEIYSFCYDTTSQQMTYIRYRLRSPNLLRNRSLQDIRSYFETVFRAEETKDVYLNAYVTMMMKIPENAELHKTFMVMELGHPADMIFPNWKKPFYYAGNHALLLHPLKHQWRKIGYFVRKLAEKKLGEIKIITGTAPFPNGKLFGTFWKLVVYKKQAIAVILHNIYEEPPKEETKIDGNQLPENNTNADKKPPRKKKISKPYQKETTLSKIPINKHPHPFKTEINVTDETSKKESNVAEEPSEKEPVKETGVVDQPSEKEPGVVDETSKKDTETHDEDKHSMLKFCLDICHENGFGGVVSRELVFPAYCCTAEQLAKSLGLVWPEKYGLLNLKETPRDTSVIDNDCPTDPLETPIIEGET